MEGLIVGGLVVLGGVFLAARVLWWLFSALFSQSETRQYGGESSGEMVFAPTYSEPTHARRQPVSLPQMILGALIVWLFSDT
jgi:hypothetical protein